jgi:hypothetical protein
MVENGKGDRVVGKLQLGRFGRNGLARTFGLSRLWSPIDPLW